MCNEEPCDVYASTELASHANSWVLITTRALDLKYTSLNILYYLIVIYLLVMNACVNRTAC